MVEGERRIQNGILLVKVNHTDVVVYTSHKAEVTKKGLCQNRAAGIEPTTCWESSSKKKKKSSKAHWESTESSSTEVQCRHILPERAVAERGGAALCAHVPLT
jgi:hypothetical protein